MKKVYARNKAVTARSLKPLILHVLISGALPG